MTKMKNMQNAKNITPTFYKTAKNRKRKYLRFVKFGLSEKHTKFEKNLPQKVTIPMLDLR